MLKINIVILQRRTDTAGPKSDSPKIAKTFPQEMNLNLQCKLVYGHNWHIP